MSIHDLLPIAYTSLPNEYMILREDDSNIIILIIFYLSNFGTLFIRNIVRGYIDSFFWIRKKELDRKCCKTTVSNTANTIQTEICTKRHTPVFDYTIYTNGTHIKGKDKLKCYIKG